jgi:hypothetical protein
MFASALSSMLGMLRLIFGGFDFDYNPDVKGGIHIPPTARNPGANPGNVGD